MLSMEEDDFDVVAVAEKMCLLGLWNWSMTVGEVGANSKVKVEVMSWTKTLRWGLDWML